MITLSKSQEADLLVDAGKALVKVPSLSIPKGSSRPFREAWPHDLESALREYSQEKIDQYVTVLKKYRLYVKAENLKSDYRRLKSLAEDYRNPPVTVQQIGGMKRS